MSDPTKSDAGKAQRAARFFGDAVHRPRLNKRSTLDWGGRHIGGDPLATEATPEPKAKPRKIGEEAFRETVEGIQRARDAADDAGDIGRFASDGKNPV